MNLSRITCLDIQNFKYKNNRSAEYILCSPDLSSMNLSRITCSHYKTLDTF